MTHNSKLKEESVKKVIKEARRTAKNDKEDLEGGRKDV